MAAPHVTGVLGLVMGKYPGLKWDEAKKRVLDSYRPVSSLIGKTIKPGVVNAFNAVIDCNKNGIRDDCDIQTCDTQVCGVCGTISDCDGNGIPDDCEIDCDMDGMADVCTSDPWFPPEPPIKTTERHYIHEKNRYLTFSPQNAGEQTAIRAGPAHIKPLAP